MAWPAGIDARAGDRFFPAALADPDGDIRHYAGEALGRLGKSAGKVVLGSARDLVSGVPANRNQAAYALKKIGAAAKAVRAITAALADPDAKFRRLAALALAGIVRGADKAVAALVPMLTDAAPDIHWTAPHAFGAVGPKDEGGASADEGLPGRELRCPGRCPGRHRQGAGERV